MLKISSIKTKSFQSQIYLDVFILVVHELSILNAESIGTYVLTRS